MANVPVDLPRKTRHRREYPAGQQIPFDLGEPELDLVEPRGIRRREVEVHVRMRQQGRPDGLRLVGGQVVGDDVDLTAVRLFLDLATFSSLT
jgi:hypothetical protein